MVALADITDIAPLAPAACSTPAPTIEPGRDSLTIAEVADRTGVTAHTLRYYERIGLLDCPRDEGGRRRYTEVELNRVVFITRLRLTEKRIRDIQAYFRLVAQGPGNEDQRLALLQRHRERVVARIAELVDALAVVDYKIDTYGGTR